MCRVQEQKFFPNLSELLLLQCRNWQDELPLEQFSAIVLAYNDRLTGKLRNAKRGDRHVYELSKEELGILEAAYRSGRNDNRNKADVVARLSKVCIPEVAEVVSSTETRKQKLQDLHNMAVKQIVQMAGVEKEPFYAKLDLRRQKLEADEAKERFKDNCSTLDKYSDQESCARIYSSLPRLTTDQRNLLWNEMTNQVDGALEGVFTRVLNSVRYAVGMDAYLEAQTNRAQKEEIEAV